MKNKILLLALASFAAGVVATLLTMVVLFT